MGFGAFVIVAFGVILIGALYFLQNEADND